MRYGAAPDQRQAMRPGFAVDCHCAGGLAGLGDCGCNKGSSSGGFDFSSVPPLVWIGLAVFGAALLLKKK
jgi:hypothetical protein